MLKQNKFIHFPIHKHSYEAAFEMKIKPPYIINKTNLLVNITRTKRIESSKPKQTELQASEFISN